MVPVPLLMLQFVMYKPRKQKMHRRAVYVEILDFGDILKTRLKLTWQAYSNGFGEKYWPPNFVSCWRAMEYFNLQPI